MKVGDVVFVKSLNNVVEVLFVREDAIKVWVNFIEDIGYEMWITKKKYKNLIKVGEL